MAQTSYSINIPAVAYPGQPADIGIKDKTTGLSVAAAIPFGVLGVIDATNSTDGQHVAAKLPSLATDITDAGSALGVALADQSQAQNPNFTVPTWDVNHAVPFCRQGRVWVLVEEAVIAGGPVFVRYASGAGGSQLGAFRTSADTSTAAQLPGAVYKTKAAAGAYAQVELNLV